MQPIWVGVKEKRNSIEFLCDPDRIQTCNLLIRSQMLYSVELRDRVSCLTMQKYNNFYNLQNIWKLFFKKISFFYSKKRSLNINHPSVMPILNPLLCEL